MALQVEVWLQDLQENLFPSNEFYQNSLDDSTSVSGIDGKTVHIPQAGSKPSVEKNRTTLPATITQRSDSDRTYTLDEYTTDPILVQNTEEVETSYQKRQNILMEHEDKLNTDIASDLAYYWAATKSDNIIRTSGSDTRDATAPGATGTRKVLAKDDFIRAREILNRMDVPTGNNMLFALIPPEFEADIMGISGFVEADKIGNAQLVDGMIGRLLGFNIFVRSSAVVYDDSATPQPKAPGASGATSDNLGAIFWSRSMVRRAVGTVDVFIDEDKPEYYGDVFSALVRSGGKKSRDDEKGVVSIVQQS